MNNAIEFLRRCDGTHRIVSSSDLTPLQLAEARLNKKFFVDKETGFGWALLPWELTTRKDMKRERELNAARSRIEDDTI